MKITPIDTDIDSRRQKRDFITAVVGLTILTGIYLFAPPYADQLFAKHYPAYETSEPIDRTLRYYNSKAHRFPLTSTLTSVVSLENVWANSSGITNQFPDVNHLTRVGYAR